MTPDETRGHRPVARLRHSITDTDYQVAGIRELPGGSRLHPTADGLRRAQCDELPLTGLTRKILRRLALESAKPVAEI